MQLYFGNKKQNKSDGAEHFSFNGCTSSFLITIMSITSKMQTCQAQKEICKNIKPISF